MPPDEGYGPLSEEYRRWIRDRWGPMAAARVLAKYGKEEPARPILTAPPAPEDPWVELTEEEIAFASSGGSARHEATTAMGKREQEVSAALGEQFHRGGAVAELAFGRWRGVPWDPRVQKYVLVAADDVAGMEVRSTVLPCPCGHPSGCLRVNRKGTKPDSVYVLVIRHPNRRFEVAGWLRGRDAMQEKWWGKHYYRQQPGWSEYCFGAPREVLNRDLSILKTCD